MSKTALLLIDLQYDFLPGGSLAVAGGDQVIPVANRMIEFARDHGWYVVATQDWHPENHGSFAVNNAGTEMYGHGELDGLPQVWWPAHCVQGTRGAEIVENLLRPDAIVQKGTNVSVDSYSGFFDNAHKSKTELDDLLKKQEIDTVVVLGIATDYCVKFTVLDAIELGYKVYVVQDACRGVDMPEGSAQAALEEMDGNGAELIKSSEIVTLI